MNELELYIITGLNAVEAMKTTLKQSAIIPLGINPRIDMIEQLLKTIQKLLEEEHGQDNRATFTNETLP